MTKAKTKCETNLCLHLLGSIFFVFFLLLQLIRLRNKGGFVYIGKNGKGKRT